MCSSQRFCVRLQCNLHRFNYSIRKQCRAPPQAQDMLGLKVFSQFCEGLPDLLGLVKQNPRKFKERGESYARFGSSKSTQQRSRRRSAQRTYGKGIRGTCPRTKIILCRETLHPKIRSALQQRQIMIHFSRISPREMNLD